MIVTKDKNRVVVEVSAEELRRHNLSYSLLDCRDVHTRNTIKRLLLEATGEVSSKAQEICLLPSSEDGCVIVFEEKAKENSERRFLLQISFIRRYSLTAVTERQVSISKREFTPPK